MLSKERLPYDPGDLVPLWAWFDLVEAILLNGFVLGIDIGGTKVALATVTQSGAPLLSRRLPTLADDGAGVVLDRLIEAAQEITQETARDEDLALVGVGAVSPGIIRDEGILLAPNNPGWHAVPLRARLAHAFPGVPVTVMNDVRAAASAEASFGALAGADSGIFVNLGTGVSAAILINGTVIDGEHGAAGEIAYQLTGSSNDPAYDQGHAPLEERVSGQGIADRASALLGRRVTTREAFERAETDPALRALIDDAFDALAVQITNLAVALDPARVVLGGGLVPHCPDLLPRITALLGRAAPFPPQVLPADLLDDAALAGALVIAMRSAGSPLTAPVVLGGSR